MTTVNPLAQFFTQKEGLRKTSAPDTSKQGYAFLDISNLAMAAVYGQSKGIKLVPRGTEVSAMGEKTTQVMSLEFVRFLVLNTLLYNITNFRKDYPNIVLCFDNSSEGGYWRRDIADYYKDNRKKNRKESDFPFADYFDCLSQVKQELIDIFPYRIMDVPRAEADDCIAIMAKHLSDKGIKSLIISADGDFKQLQKHKHITQWSPTQKRYISVTPEEAAFEKMTKIIKGDKKDNVGPITMRPNYWLTREPGERSPSIKTSFVQECADNEENITDIITDEKMIERYFENRELIDFDYIREDIKESVIETFDGYEVNGREKIYNFLLETRNKKLMERLHDF